VFAPPEPSAVLLARAANAVNKRWWERAADGNISMVQEIWKKEDRQDLLAVREHMRSMDKGTKLLRTVVLIW
jgi:hypothetical protein